MMEKTERAKYWEALIVEQSASDATVKGFCQERELSEASFYWWRRELQVDWGRTQLIIFLVSTLKCFIGSNNYLRLLPSCRTYLL